MSSFKKLISLFLVAVMVLTVVPVGTAAQVGGTEPSQFTLNFEAGINYFGFPVRIEKAIADIFPGLDVYRRDGDSWVLANNEQPMPFAAYRVNVNAPMTVLLQGETYSEVSLAIPANKTTYFTLPQVDAIGIQELFGAAAKSVRVVGSGGLASSVPLTGQILPGKVYLIVLNSSVTVTIKAEDNAPVIDEVKFNGEAVADGGTVTLTVLEGQAAEGTVTFKASDDKGLSVVKVNGEEVEGVAGEYSKKLTLSVGENVVVIEATDQAGQIATYSFTVVVNKDNAPVIDEVGFVLDGEEFSPETGTTISRTYTASELPVNATLTFTATDAEGEVTVSVLVDDVPVDVQENSALFVFTDFGIYEIKIMAKDESGNEEVYSFSVKIVEDKKPVIEEVELIVTTAGNENRVSLPTTGTITVSDVTATLTFTATDDVELVEVKVNGATLDLTDGSYQKQLMLASENVITIVAKDNKGQESTFTATVYVKVDKLPTIKDVSLEIGNKTITAENETSTSVAFAEIPESASLKFTATDDIALKSYTVYVNGEQWLYQGVIGKTVSRQIEIPLQEGENTVRITAKDSADQEKEFVFTVKVVKDQKPILSNVELVVETAGQENRVSLPHTGTITVSDLTATLTFTATDDVQLAEVTVNGETLDLTDGTYSKQLGLDENENVITISIKDNAGQIESFTATVNVKLDELPEVNDVTLTIDGTEKTINDGDTIQLILKEAQLPLGATVVFEVDDDNDVAAVNMKVAESAITFSSTDPYTATFAFDSFGTYEVVITAVDDADQVREFRFTVKVLKDTVPEITSVQLAIESAGTTATLTPDNGGRYDVTLSDLKATLTVSATDEVGETLDIEVKLNGHLVTPSSTGIYSLDFVEGLNTVEIAAVDDAGQTATYSFEVYVNLNQLPKVQNVEVVWGTQAQSVEAGATVSLTIAEKDLPAPVKVKFDASDREGGVSVKVTLDGKVVSTAMTAVGTLHVEPQISMKTGTHTIEIIATDDDQQTTTFAFTVVITQDSKPTISDVKLVLTGAEKTVTVMPSDTIQVITLPIPAQGTLTFTASDDVETPVVVVKVNNDVLTSNNGAYTYSFTSTGNYTIYIAATDSANQTTTVSFSIRLVEDTKPEIKDVQLQVGATTIAATNGERYTATVPSVPAVGSLTFTVADDQAVSAVAVKVDGATVAVTHVSGNIYTATYSFDASQIDYTVTISTTDSSGQPASMSFKVKLDRPPQVKAVSLKVDDSLDVPLVDGETATLGVRSLGTGTITVKVADDSDTIDGSSSEITVNGELAVKSDEDSTLVATYNFLTATTYHIVVKVVDLAGQVVTFESWVTLVEDEQDPSISNVQLVLAGAETGTTITATDGGEYNVTMPLPTRATITFTATDDVAVYDAWVEVTKDGDSLVKLDVTGNYTATYEFTAAGSYTISIKAKDDVDNVTTYTIQLNLTEDKKPTISDVELSYKGISGQDLSEGLTDAASVDITVSDPTATLTFSATDTIELVEVKVNGATLALTDGSYTKLLTLSSGANRIEITAKDNVGQETTFTCTVNVTIDRFPTISDVTLKLGEESYTLENGETLILSDLPEDGTLNFLISDDVQLTSYEIKVNDVVILGGNTTLKSLSLPLPVTLAESNVIYIKAVDSNNQTVEFRAVVAKNSAPTISNVSIEISGETVSDIASGATLTFIFQEPVNATVSFEAFDDVEVSQVQVLIDGTPLTATKVEGTYIATTTFTATGTYTILIEVTDNMGVTSTHSFAVEIKLDTTAPTLLSLTAYKGTEAIEAEGNVIHWELGDKVDRIEAKVSEPVRIVSGANAVVTMSGGPFEDAEYGYITVDEDDPTKVIITPNLGNETAGLVGTFTFQVAAGVIEDLAGNKNATVTITLEVEDAIP